MAFRIARRLFVKLLGIIGFLLALAGGALIAYSAVSDGGLSPSFELVIRAFEALLGLGAIIAGIIIYTGPMKLGGIFASIAGILLLVITAFAMPALMVFAAGIIGIIGATIKPPWWKFWKH